MNSWMVGLLPFISNNLFTRCTTSDTCPILTLDKVRISMRLTRQVTQSLQEPSFLLIVALATVYLPKGRHILTPELRSLLYRITKVLLAPIGHGAVL